LLGERYRDPSHPATTALQMLDLAVIQHDLARLLRRLEAKQTSRVAEMAVQMLDLVVIQHNHGRLLRRIDAKLLNRL
jgi:hypothetical protein